MRPQCEKQVGVRPTLRYNAVTIPVAVICPHFAEPGSKWCAAHQPDALLNDADAQGAAAQLEKLEQ